MGFAPAERLRRLMAALEERSAGAADLEIVAGEQDSSFTMRLASPLGPVAVMRLSEDAVTVTTRSGGLHADAGDSEIVDNLGVDLSSGFRWDAVQCETAEELAYLLVKHMRRRVRDADPEPRIK